MAENKKTSDVGAYTVRHFHQVECYDHMHFQTEIAIVHSGKLILKREKDIIELKAGQATLLMPYESHGYSSPENASITIIEFSPLLIEEIHDRRNYINCIFEVSSQTLEYVLNMLPKSNATPVYIKALLYPVLYDLFQEPSISSPTVADNHVVKNVLEYIEKSYSVESVSLKTAADMAGCSYVYLSRAFSKFTGISFTNYLNRYRVIRAANELKWTNSSITDIAYNNGFGSLRNFNREFKKCLGVTPSAYRKNGFDDYMHG